MHRTEGDGYLDSGVGKYTSPINIYADEDPPTRDATQLRHEEMNAVQEEISNVIEGEGISLNASTEAPNQMHQLEDAINAKLKSDRINNDSFIVVGANVTEALNNLNALIEIERQEREDADDIILNIADNNSADIATLQDDVGTVVGDDLQTQINDLDSTDIADSSIHGGPTVFDSLSNINNFVSNKLYGQNVIAYANGSTGPSLGNLNIDLYKIGDMVHLMMPGITLWDIIALSGETPPFAMSHFSFDLTDSKFDPFVVDDNKVQSNTGELYWMQYTDWSLPQTYYRPFWIRPPQASSQYLVFSFIDPTTGANQPSISFDTNDTINMPAALRCSWMTGESKP